VWLFVQENFYTVFLTTLNGVLLMSENWGPITNGVGDHGFRNVPQFKGWFAELAPAKHLKDNMSPPMW
jgi:hypothetical protein